MSTPGSLRYERRWWALFATCFALFMIMLDNTIVNVALPAIQRSLKTDPSSLEWTISGYILAFAVLIPLGGKLGDRFGRKRIFLGGLLIFTAASAACALSGTTGELIAARGVQGVGAALMNPLSLSIIVNAFPTKQASTAIGIWAGVSALGLAIGPLLGGLLIKSFSWSAVFWINVPVGVIAAVVTLFAVVESRDPTVGGFDVFGTALITGGLLSLVWGLIETNSHAWSSTYTIGFLAGSAVLIVAFVAWELRTQTPMIPLAFFRARLFSIPSVVVMLLGLVLFGGIYLLALYLQNVKGYTALQAGVRMLPLTLMIMIFAPPAGRLVAKIGPRPLMSLGMLLVAAGMAGLTQLHPTTPYSHIWPFFVLFGMGIALTMPSTTSAAMGAVTADKVGVASGVVNATRQVGGAIGVAVLASVSATVASRRWHDKLSLMPPSIRGRAGQLEQLVVGGQARAVGAIAGRPAQALAAAAFTDGVRTAMWVSAALALAGAMVAFLGLMGLRFVPSEHVGAAVEF